jgi:hypothetical protein
MDAATQGTEQLYVHHQMNPKASRINTSMLYRIFFAPLPLRRSDALSSVRRRLCIVG